MLKQKSICLKINARKSINKGNQGKKRDFSGRTNKFVLKIPKTPHIHATIVPIVQTERKKQKGGVRDVDNIVEGTRSRLSRRDIGRKPLYPVYAPMRSWAVPT